MWSVANHNVLLKSYRGVFHAGSVEVARAD